MNNQRPFSPATAPSSPSLVKMLHVVREIAHTTKRNSLMCKLDELEQEIVNIGDSMETKNGALSLKPSIERDMIIKLKNVVVNIEQMVNQPLNAEKDGVFNGTGFICDAKLGIIATNYHLCGTSPQQVKITFVNGHSAPAKVLFYDAWHDFAFYIIQDLSRLKMPLQQAEFADSFQLKEQDEALLIGNNENQEYSVKFGRVSNLVVNSGKRHSACLQTTFDRTGGSSGSPVFDHCGKVIGIHAEGTDTTSIELRAEYIRDALDQLRLGKKPSRGDIGIDLDLMLISDAILHFNFPEVLANEIRDSLGNIKYISYISRLPPNQCESIEDLRPGDIVLRCENQLIGDNLYLFDKLVDQKVNKEVTIHVVRNGECLVIRAPVEDVETKKTRRFVKFAGGIFQELNPLIRRKFEVATHGTFLTHVEKGSCLSSLGNGTKTHATSFATVIEEISGIPTPNLDAFIHAIRDILKAQRTHIYILYRNLRNYRTSAKVHPIILEYQFSPLKVFFFSESTRNWSEEELSSL